MTTQTKTFIELSDIIGLRLECKNCGCSLLLEIEKDSGTINNLMADNNVLLNQCPTCAHAWAQTIRGTAGDSEIKEFFRAMRILKKLESRYGCALSLEIKPEGSEESEEA